MTTESGSTCCGATGRPASADAGETKARPPLAKYLALGLLLAAAWWLLYRSLQPLSVWLTYGLLRLPQGSHLSAAVEFFVFEVPKVLMLLTVVVFGVGIVRSFFTPERTRRILAGKRESVGNVLAALLGVVTPFCSCSAVPLFIGFVTAGVPLGVTFSFLISAPMVNEVALVLLFGLFGWKVAGLYLGTGLLIAIVAGWVIGRLKLERHVEEWVYETQVGEGVDRGGAGLRRPACAWASRPCATSSARSGCTWCSASPSARASTATCRPTPWPPSWARAAWWSVPLAVLIGVPMYSNAAGIIPIVQALLGKGAALGTVLAFMMAVIGLSLPETIILRKVLKPRLIAVFFGVVAVGILIVGYLFNLLM